MSTPAYENIGAPPQPWDLWFRQILAIMRLELKKSFVGRRLIGVYFLSLAPVTLLALRAILPLHATEMGDPGVATMVFAVQFQTFVLRLAIFFGCMAIFSSLFRREVLEKTLHYYLLAPVQREVLVAGKYLSGLVAAVIFFAGSTIACFILMYLPYGGKFMEEFFTHGNGTRQLIAYVCVAIMACVGYGAVFLFVGIYTRNPIVPAGLIFGWELINFLLPSFLKKISVIHYLQSLCPVPLPQGPLAIITEPTSPWVSVPGFIGMTVLIVLLSAIQVRRLEVTYGAE